MKELLSIEQVGVDLASSSDHREPAPAEAPDGLVRADELPIYLKKNLETLPVAVTVPSSSACMILMHCPDTANAIKTADLLRKRLKSNNALGRCKVLREGTFVQVMINDCKRRAHIDDLIQAIRDASTLKPTRSVDIQQYKW